MPYSERRLPHWIPDAVAIFVTRRLADSGPRWLAAPALAEIVANAIQFGSASGHWYELHAWVVMPNHVHVVMRPIHNFSKIMRWLKWTTARRCNESLGRTGIPFWQDESYDHWIRDRHEFHSVVNYVEQNPVRAGLVEQAEDWAWSSANGRPTSACRLILWRR
jgi:REP element-mobilizing transposase RayT